MTTPLALLSLALCLELLVKKPPTSTRRLPRLRRGHVKPVPSLAPPRPSSMSSGAAR